MPSDSSLGLLARRPIIYDMMRSTTRGRGMRARDEGSADFLAYCDKVKETTLADVELRVQRWFWGVNVCKAPPWRAHGLRCGQEVSGCGWHRVLYERLAARLSGLVMGRVGEEREERNLI